MFSSLSAAFVTFQIKGGESSPTVFALKEASVCFARTDKPLDCSGPRGGLGREEGGLC